MLHQQKIKRLQQHLNCKTEELVTVNAQASGIFNIFVRSPNSIRVAAILKFLLARRLSKILNTLTRKSLNVYFPFHQLPAVNWMHFFS